MLQLEDVSAGYIVPNVDEILWRKKRTLDTK